MDKFTTKLEINGKEYKYIDLKNVTSSDNYGKIFKRFWIILSEKKNGCRLAYLFWLIQGTVQYTVLYLFSFELFIVFFCFYAKLC